MVTNIQLKEMSVLDNHIKSILELILLVGLNSKNKIELYNLSKNNCNEFMKLYKLLFELSEGTINVKKIQKPISLYKNNDLIETKINALNNYSVLLIENNETKEALEYLNRAFHLLSSHKNNIKYIDLDSLLINTSCKLYLQERRFRLVLSDAKKNIKQLELELENHKTNSYEEHLELALENVYVAYNEIEKECKEEPEECATEYFKYKLPIIIKLFYIDSLKYETVYIQTLKNMADNSSYEKQKEMYSLILNIIYELYLSTKNTQFEDKFFKYLKCLSAIYYNNHYFLESKQIDEIILSKDMNACFLNNSFIAANSMYIFFLNKAILDDTKISISVTNEVYQNFLFHNYFLFENNLVEQVIEKASSLEYDNIKYLFDLDIDTITLALLTQCYEYDHIFNEIEWISSISDNKDILNFIANVEEITNETILNLLNNNIFEKVEILQNNAVYEYYVENIEEAIAEYEESDEELDYDIKNIITIIDTEKDTIEYDIYLKVLQDYLQKLNETYINKLSDNVESSISNDSNLTDFELFIKEQDEKRAIKSQGNTSVKNYSEEDDENIPF